MWNWPAHAKRSENMGSMQGRNTWEQRSDQNTREAWNENVESREWSSVNRKWSSILQTLYSAWRTYNNNNNSWPLNYWCMRRGSFRLTPIIGMTVWTLYQCRDLINFSFVHFPFNREQKSSAVRGRASAGRLLDWLGYFIWWFHWTAVIVYDCVFVNFGWWSSQITVFKIIYTNFKNTVIH